MIFVHLGLPKTGTTYLQRTVFERLDTRYITYLGKAKGVELNDIEDKLTRRYLVSSEHIFGNPFTCKRGQWRNEFSKNLSEFCRKHEDVRFIMSIRAQKSLIVSYYKEHISKGGRDWYPHIEDFFGIDHMNGQVTLEDFVFSHLIREVSEASNSVPLIIRQEDLWAREEEVVKRICKFLSVPEVDLSSIPNIAINKGVGKRNSVPLRYLNELNKLTSGFGINMYSKVFIKLGLTPDYIFRKRLAFLDKGELSLSPQVIEFIEGYYKEDNKRVTEFMEKNNMLID